MKHYDFMYSGACWLLGQRNGSPVEVYVAQSREDALKKAESYVQEHTGELTVRLINGEVESVRTFTKNAG